MFLLFFFSSRRRHTRCALVTGVQTCALPILADPVLRPKITCKWPNDVLLGGAKLAGILLESRTAATGGGLDWVIVGIGVNLAHFPPDTPYEIGRASCRERVCQYV